MSVAAADAVLEELRGLGLTPDVRSLQLPETQVVGPWRVRRPTRKAILGSLFYVYGKEARLRSPIDWLQDPEGSRSWRYELHTFTWLKEALARHAVGGDVETLAVARDKMLDWAWAHKEDREEQSEFAWYDMAVGLRAPYLAYVLRACLAEGMLDETDAALLLAMAERHGAELARRKNYAERNNHGLFQDEGLFLLTRLLPTLPAADAWRELALQRLDATLRATVSFADGAHLEHSTAYQFVVVDLVARLAANIREMPELTALLERMRRTAAWQTTPAGRMVQFGDTDDLPAPRWACETAVSLSGVHFLPEAGMAFVREGDSYLAVTAGFHSPAHKHSDDASFLLIEGGQVLLGDAGRWGYYEDEPDRIYARSAAAHNVLTVDDQDVRRSGAEPYGSGLEAVGEGEGWYAIAVTNPLLMEQGVEHHRVLFYRPARTLMIFDQVRSDRRCRYVRRLHFGPSIELAPQGGNRVAIAGGAKPAMLTEMTEGVELSVERGKRDGSYVGWTYPGDRERTEVWTATLSSHGDEMNLLTGISLDGQPVVEPPDEMRRYL